MNRSPTKSKRDPLDFYPTPNDVTRALASWLVARENLPPLTANFLDPASGDGALIRAWREHCSWWWRWYAIELEPNRAAACLRETAAVACADSLLVEWPADAHVVANPPFMLLDAFWKKASEHRARHRRWVAMFMPVAWWNAGRREGYVMPDHILALGWRPSFKAEGAKGAQDYAWSVLEPVPCEVTQWHRLRRTA